MRSNDDDDAGNRSNCDFVNDDDAFDCVRRVLPTQAESRVHRDTNS